MQTISIATNKGVEFYNVNNIIRVQGMSNYCKIFFADNSHPLTVAKVLHWFEVHLPPDIFWRTHKTHLVNSSYVNKMRTTQKPYLIMSSGEVLAISRRRAYQFKNAG